MGRKDDNKCNVLCILADDDEDQGELVIYIFGLLRFLRMETREVVTQVKNEEGKMENKRKEKKRESRENKWVKHVESEFLQGLASYFAYG